MNAAGKELPIRCYTIVTKHDAKQYQSGAKDTEEEAEEEMTTAWPKLHRVVPRLYSIATGSPIVVAYHFIL